MSPQTSIAKIMGLIFTVQCNFDLRGAFSHITVCTMMALPVLSFMFHSPLLTAKSVDLVATITHDDIFSQWKLPLFFIAATLFAELLFKQFLIKNNWQ